MAKNVLETDIQANFYLLGIVSNSPDYQLAWQMNEALHIELSRIKDHHIQFKNDQFLSTSKFEYESEYQIFTLIKNKLNEGEGQLFLLPEIKNIDYLLLIDDETENLEILNVKSTLSKINNVILVQNIDVAKLKSIDNLYND